MEYKYEAGEWVEVDVNETQSKVFKNNKEPEWVKAQITGITSYGMNPSLPAYIFQPEPKPGHGNIFLEIHVRKPNVK